MSGHPLLARVLADAGLLGEGSPEDIPHHIADHLEAALGECQWPTEHGDPCGLPASDPEHDHAACGIGTHEPSPWCHPYVPLVAP